MKRLISKISGLSSKIKLRGRMFLIYIIGGILPLLCANFYTYTQTKNMLIEQAKEAEISELSLIADSIEESMNVANELSKRLYFDDTIEHIAFTQYEDYQQILEDYRNYDTLSNYLKYYDQEISSIHIYLDNDTIADNEYFIYATDAITSTEWYQNTLEEAGNPYWSYVYNKQIKKYELQLSRVLYTRDMQQVGVLSIVMQNQRTETSISNRENQTMLVYDDTFIIHSNFKEDEEQVLSILDLEEGDCFNQEVEYNGEQCLLTVVEMQPEYAKDVYSLVSICPYGEIAADARTTTGQSMISFAIGILFATAAILIFSGRYSARITTFKKEMHKAAGGNFHITKELGGNDEITELYEDLNVMIADISKLMNEVMEEKLQKESLNARQKEVEFKMLASQINPHFLYNTLETIRMKARINNQLEIEELAKMLAKIMRRNIQVGDSLQTLKSELQLVEYYLKIQDYRFHDRITSSIVVDQDEIAGLKIMPLLIQPFVENAFVHGLEEKEAEGKIVIQVEVRSHLWITIEDNGCGMTDEEQEELRKQMNDFETLDRTHIGVSNVNQRIRIKYGEQYGVAFESILGEGTKIMIKLPLVYDEHF